MAIIKQTSLDTIIELIKRKTQDQKQAQQVVVNTNKEIQALYAQAQAALEGTGMSLVLSDSQGISLVNDSEIKITHWRNLRIGDKIRVRCAGHTYRNDTWDYRTVDALEPYDYEGTVAVRVDENLADHSCWIDVEDDQWEFISRP